MKYLTFAFSAMLIMATLSLDAQNREIRQARNAVVQYYNSLNTDVEKLKEGVNIISEVVKTEAGAEDFNARLEAGSIFSTAFRDPQIGGANNPQYALMSYQNYKKALGLATRRHQERDASSGLAEATALLINGGVNHYELGDHQKALEYFDLVFEGHNTLAEGGYESELSDPEQYNEHAFRTAFMAYQVGNYDRALALLENLYENEADLPGVYEILAAIYVNQDNPRAAQVLERGLERYPDNKGLQYAELNYYLRLGELESLIGRLERAIAGEPDNATLYSTLGNVYDNLYQKTFEEGDEEKSEHYFEQAMRYYNQAIGINPEFGDAIYSIGALYFNRAAYITREMVELERDYSREATQRYSALQKKVNELFEKALPYFLQAEAIDPNDPNVLVALQRIYANMDNLEKAQEYRDRLNTLQQGN